MMWWWWCIVVADLSCGLLVPRKPAARRAVVAHGVRSRVRSKLGGVLSRFRRRKQEEEEEVSPLLSVLISTQTNATVSEATFAAVAALTNFEEVIGRVGFRVGTEEKYFVVDGPRNRCEYSDASSTNATVSYSSERVFEQVMEGQLRPAAALALGKLRVGGSLSAASSTEPLFEEAERRLREQLRPPSRREAEAALIAALEVERQVVRAAQSRESSRSQLESLTVRHAGTEQQIGALLLTLGSVLYVGYTGLGYNLLQDAANLDYFVSAWLWLLGSLFLIRGSYPEAVLALASQAESDALNPERLRESRSWSDILLAAWGLGLGAPTFLAGAAEQTVANAYLIIPWLYDFAGLFICFATGVMVFGALPGNLAANEGRGSDRVLQALPDNAFFARHLQNDLLAGSWFFAGFMVVCAIFGVVDLAVEPSVLTVAFFVSQIPFAAGAVLLAKATYPENLNTPHNLFFEDARQRLDDKMLLLLLRHDQYNHHRAPTGKPRDSEVV